LVKSKFSKDPLIINKRKILEVASKMEHKANASQELLLRALLLARLSLLANNRLPICKGPKPAYIADIAFPHIQMAEDDIKLSPDARPN
jgi:hypothetical protein